MKWHKTKFAVYAFALIIVISVVANGIYCKIEYENRAGDKEEIGLLEAPYLYNFHTYTNPDIKDMPFYGDQDASVTIIAFLDIESETSKNFMNDIFIRIKKDYIDDGKVRYYHKNYITLEDIEEKNNRFVYSMALGCIKKIKKEEYYPVYFEIFSIDIKDMQKLLEKQDIPIKDYQNCIDGEDILDELYKNALEVKSLGAVGMNQRFYIGIMGRDNTILDGIPKYIRFQRAIRQHEIQVGN